MNSTEWEKNFDPDNKYTRYGPEYTFGEIKLRVPFEVLSKLVLKEHGALNESKYLRRMRVFEENYITFPISWTTHTFSMFYDSLEKFVLEAHQHGHLNYFVSKYTLPPLPKPEDLGPQVLTMDMLSAGFIVWIFTVILAIISFVFEHIFYYFHNKRKLPKIIRVKTKVTCKIR